MTYVGVTHGVVSLLFDLFSGSLSFPNDIAEKPGNHEK